MGNFRESWTDDTCLGFRVFKFKGVKLYYRATPGKLGENALIWEISHIIVTAACVLFSEDVFWFHEDCLPKRFSL